MKKLNRKGFTLVELLAVIVILAIVVGVSIPSVTSIINGSKDSALSVAVESALDYLKDQYDIYNIDTSAIVSGDVADTAIAAGTTGVTYNINDTNTAKKTAAQKAFKELGFKEKNVSKIVVKIIDNPVTQTATFCVEIAEIPKASDYFITSKWALNTTTGLALPKASPNNPSNKQGDGC